MGVPSTSSPLFVGRYAIYDVIAAGGMATVHLGRLIGPVGFSRTVAIKRLHAQYAHDPEFTRMFLDEAKLAARVQHPNVVPTVDVVVSNGELLLVMEYVRGESLSRLVRAARDRGERVPARVVVAIVSGALQGLHAAHEAIDEKGKPLGLVHRDMSPQNILIGIDGTARVLDFGVAKAEGRMHQTREGQVKGKLLYMPPEQMSAQPVTRTADVYAVGVVLFEALTGARMFAGEDERASVTRILSNQLRMPSEYGEELAVFDPVVRRACQGDALLRYPSAREMALELEKCMLPASAAEVADWVQHLAAATLDDRARKVAEIESSTMSTVVPASSTVRPPPLPVRGIARPWKIAAAGGAALLLLSIVTIAYLLGTRSRAAIAAAEPPKIVAASAPSPASPPSTAPAPPPPSALASAPVIAPATTTVAPQGSKPKTNAPVKAVSCNPPYVLDKSGHKHFIPECVQ